MESGEEGGVLKLKELCIASAAGPDSVCLPIVAQPKCQIRHICDYEC